MAPVDSLSVGSTAVGGASFLVQVFQGCVKSFELWRKGEELADEAEVFQVRLEMQAAKLKTWGVEWGLDRGPDSMHLKDRRFQEHGDVAVKYVVLIYHFLDELGKLEQDFPAISSASNTSISTASSITKLLDMADPTSVERKDLEAKLKSIQDDAGLKDKMKWALHDGGPLKALDQLKNLVDELLDFFKPPKVDPAAKLALNSLLATLSLAKLQTLSSQSDENSELRGLALLKSAIIEMDARKTVLGGEDVKEKDRFLAVTGARDEKSGRSYGVFTKNGMHDVLVEWKLVDPVQCPPNDSRAMYKMMLKHRIENLARLLKAEYKPVELRTLSCIGVVTKHLVDEKLEHGLVFNVPGTTHQCLSQILEGTGDGLDAGDWYRIARSISRALLYMHLAGWLHKGIRSDNILFFAENNSSFSYDKPFIVGFEYSREALALAQTEGVTDDFEFNLYRHPDVQGLPAAAQSATTQATSSSSASRIPFDYTHDQYSLGILLLELGLRESIKSIQQRASQIPGYASHSAVEFRDRIVDCEVPKLASKMGKGYRDATKLCLTGGLVPTQSRSIQEQFYLKVVRVLDDYRVP
ncbi:HET-s/LopB domain protein [Byssothecium circinans]|uniref:HET-s/LopB domain protein n=1 Tax=Byssothecium circinans TaxID=147558 RepID=A0A6A5TR91_9PLEO|nr:HET-s/LopB domain protein [Byssothecium circinans]